MGITKLALSKLAGVKSSKVSVSKAQAVVVYDPREVSPEEMVRAINEGTTFRARIVAVREPTAMDDEEDCLILGWFCD